VLVVIPLLVTFLGYLLLRMPEVNRALWHSVSLQARLMATAAARHDYPMAAVDAIGAGLVALSLAGTLYITTGLARRIATACRRWSSGRPGRRLIAGAAMVTCAATLATVWTVQGGFHGW
jgi:putative peptide zinc metalloprotease protein